jgi:hypothetical protein
MLWAIACWTRAPGSGGELVVMQGFRGDVLKNQFTRGTCTVMRLRSMTMGPVARVQRYTVTEKIVPC